MTELEKVERAKMYLDKLANGIDPISGEAVPEDSTLNQVRLSRCLFYVSDLLRQIVENGGYVKPPKSAKRPKKAEFTLTSQQRAAVPLSQEPLGISRFVAALNNLVDSETVKRLKTTTVTAWLVEKGFLNVTTDVLGKAHKVPTPQGYELGLRLESYQGPYGEYQTVLYDEGAQRFLLDNLDAILAETPK